VSRMLRGRVLGGALVAGLAAGLAACMSPPPAPPDPAECLALFEDLDRAERLFPRYRFNRASDTFVQNPRVARAARAVLLSGCTTSITDLAEADAVQAELQPFSRVKGGGPAASTALQVGIVDGLTAEVRAATFFGNLGYRYRSTGTDGLGRRVFIGPIRSQAAMDQAIDVARRAGFIAPYPAIYTRF